MTNSEWIVDWLVIQSAKMLKLNYKLMSITQLKNRFKQFAIDVALLIQALPKNTVNNAYSNQLIRCSSSSAANYYAACRGKSRGDFINKLKIGA